jgi:hypothetical protein
MLPRILLAGVVCLVVHLPVQAEPVVYFRGKQLSYRHYVYGEVSSSARRAGTINLGYAHGLEPEQELGVLRRNEGKLVPIGVLRLVKVQPGESFGVYEGEFSLKREDLVIVSARELNVWEGRTRSDHLVNRSLLSRNGKGYDTGDVSPTLLNEVGRDDGYIVHKPQMMHVNTDLYATQRPVVLAPVVRGAFRPASGDEDGAEHQLSVEDREQSPDRSTLALETALAQFVSSNKAGMLDITPQGLRSLGQERSELANQDDVKIDLQKANARIRTLIRPK